MSNVRSGYTPSGLTIHNPYAVNTNFTTSFFSLLRSHIALYTTEFVPLRLDHIPKLPMFDSFPLVHLERIFIGGSSYESGVAVAAALIRYADKLYEEIYGVSDSIYVAKVNYCKPHFCVSFHSETLYEQARAWMLSKGYWLLEVDDDELRSRARTGEFRMKVGMRSYHEAIVTPKSINALLCQGLSSQLPENMCPWQVKKNTGGVQLVLLPDHARRLVSLSQYAVQDTDGTLLMATSAHSRDTINNVLKDLSRTMADTARVMCCPMRFISVEERKH